MVYPTIKKIIESPTALIDFSGLLTSLGQVWDDTQAYALAVVIGTMAAVFVVGGALLAFRAIGRRLGLMKARV